MQGQHGDTTAVMWYCRGIVCYLKAHATLGEWRARLSRIHEYGQYNIL